MIQMELPKVSLVLVYLCVNLWRWRKVVWCHNKKKTPWILNSLVLQSQEWMGIQRKYDYSGISLSHTYIWTTVQVKWQQSFQALQHCNYDRWPRTAWRVLPLALEQELGCLPQSWPCSQQSSSHSPLFSQGTVSFGLKLVCCSPRSLKVAWLLIIVKYVVFYKQAESYTCVHCFLL